MISCCVSAGRSRKLNVPLDLVTASSPAASAAMIRSGGLRRRRSKALAVDVGRRRMSAVLTSRIAEG
jgi:hypothetical protein